MDYDRGKVIRDIFGVVVEQIKDAGTEAGQAALSQREKRQRALLRMLQSDQPPVQWVAIRELGQMGDLATAAALMPFTTSSNKDLMNAARTAYRQIQEREVGRSAARPAAPVPPPVQPQQYTPAPVQQTPAAPPPPVGPTPIAPAPVTQSRPDARTEREIRRDEAEGMARMPFPGARPDAAPLVPVQRTEVEIRSDREAQTPEAQMAAGAKRTAGDTALPTLINPVRAGLQPLADAAPDMPAVPPMAQVPVTAPSLPDMADMPPA